MQAGRDGDDRSTIFGALLTAEEYAKGRRAGATPSPSGESFVSQLLILCTTLCWQAFDFGL